MKILSFLFLVMTIAFSCRPVRKVHTIERAISKRDTIQTVVIAATPKVDSQAIIRDMLDKVSKRKIDFNTFKAKIKVQYEGNETSQNATAYLKMRKDSIILIQLVGPLGIVGLEAKITNDSIIVVNKLDKYVQRRSINYVQEVTQIPFDFKTLQDLIIGNPTFLDNNVVSYKSDKNQLIVLMVGSLFKNLITLDNIDYKPLHSKLDDVDVMHNRTCDITYSNYATAGNVQFSTYRSISVSDNNKLDIYLDFKQYSFNEPLIFNFNIPKNYKKR